MKISTILTTTFLVWTAYDSNLFRRTGSRVTASSVSIEIEAEAELIQEVKKKQLQKRSRGQPWHEPIPPKLRMKVNHFSEKSKDPRYSDQRKIRRRINNM